MKTLILVRHAKSSWDDPSLRDFDRPLNKRGVKDAPRMAKIVKKMNIEPDIIISSPAVRALSTANHFAETFGYSLNSIKTDKLIYEYGPNGILKMIKSLDNDFQLAMIFGHNPDMSHLASYLTNVMYDAVPTCGVVCIDFDCDDWQKVPETKGKVRFYEYPKKGS